MVNKMEPLLSSRIISRITNSTVVFLCLFTYNNYYDDLNVFQNKQNRLEIETNGMNKKIVTSIQKFLDNTSKGRIVI